MIRQPRQKIEAHLGFIRTLPCICCGNDIETQAAHIRFSDAGMVKVNAGVGSKATDYWVLPLCGKHHDEQHRTGDERKFWARVGIDALKYALRLWSVTGNHELGCQVVAAAIQSRPSVLMAG
jgi:hypothetical protein